MEGNEQKTENSLAEDKDIYYCASLWKRLVAFLLDYIFVQIISLPLSLVVGTMLSFIRVFFYSELELSEVPEETIERAAVILIIIVAYFYFVIMEASAWRATFGKKIMKIVVTDDEGNRVSVWKSLFRTLGKFISFATFSIGFLFAFFTQKKQTLYDLIAGTFVVDKPGNMEGEKAPQLIPGENVVKQLQ